MPSRLKITEKLLAVLNDASTFPQSDPGVEPTLTSGSVRCSSNFELRRIGKLLLTVAVLTYCGHVQKIKSIL